MVEELSGQLRDEGVEHGSAIRTGLDAGVTLVPVSVAKGLELDAVVVVEPSRIVEGQAHGLRALYVALTRATQRLSVVHTGDLPAAMLMS
jgi:DNA helicase IV